MNTYKNLETYKLAFNLAIKIYRMNMLLPKLVLLKYGNRLRRTTIRIKDDIADAYTFVKNEESQDQHLTQAKVACDETINMLNKIKKSHSKYKSLNEMIKGYINLKSKIIAAMQDSDKNPNLFSLSFPENTVLEPKI